LATYRAWVQESADDAPYYDLLAFFDQYRDFSRCDASCTAAIDAIEPQALYQYGTQLVRQSKYSLAVLQFEQIVTKFPSSPYYARSYTAAAQAYYALGQQQRGTDCASAVTAYQTLVRRYADTPEAQHAKSDLAAPQNVIGRLAGWPAGIVPLMLLSRSVDPHN